MSESQHTRPSLLIRLRDSRDDQAWSQFVELYSPLIYGFVRKQGLQDADATDILQEVLRVVARTAGRFEYDAAKGSFRGWLFTVVRNELRTFLNRQRRDVHGTGDTSQWQQLDDLPGPPAVESKLWENEHQWCLFTWAAERVKAEVQPTTWKAFWQTAVEGRSGKDVGKSLSLTVAAVYLAKGRVMARLKELVRDVESSELRAMGCE